MKYTLGIDLGGTNIAAGIVDENYNILIKGSTYRVSALPFPVRSIARQA